MIILNVLWLICCIPVVTIGPATVAAHYVTMKLVRDEGRGVWTMFTHSFARNLRQGIILGILFLIVGGFLGLDFYLCLYKLHEGNGFNLVMLSALGFLTILYLIEMIYIWAVQARFDNTIKHTIINAFVIAMSNFGDTSILLAQDLILIVAAVLSIAFLPQLGILFMIFGVPLIFMLNGFRLRKIMDRYLPENQRRESD